VVLLAVAASLLAGCSLIGGGGSSAPADPAPTPRSGPAVVHDGVKYAESSPQQTLDLYLPAGDGRTVFPMVVLIHGGGFFEGTSAEQTDRANLLAGNGFAAVSLNYRLTGDAPFPAGVQDVEAAVRYVRANAPGWGVDPHRIAVWGESAGGYLASMVGATGGTRAFDDPTLGNPNVSSSVAAVVSWFGPSDFATMDDQAREAGCDQAAQQHDAQDSPESRWLGAALPTIQDRVSQASIVQHVGSASSLPPYFLVHGDQDCTVPPGQSQQLNDALRAKGARVALTIVQGAAHSDPKITDEQTGSTLEFLHAVLDPQRG
jgi:acetyl esterase/lipase